MTAKMTDGSPVGSRLWRSRAFVLVAVVFAIVALAGHAPLVSGARDSWTGTYEYEFYAGVTAGGSPISQTYRLEIGRHSPPRLRIFGYQSAETILGTTEGNDDRLEFLFLSYSDGEVVNRFGISEFEVGETLLRLERNGDGENGIITEWGAVVPSDDLPRAGLYFSRVN